MAQPGDVLYYRDYEFEDGARGDKYFVVLSEASLDSPCLVLKTTSRPGRYKDAGQGCDPEKKVFFVPTGWGECFKLDTYIQLPQVIELSTGDLLSGSFSSKITVVNSLSSDCFAQLKSCLKKFKNDISQSHWRLIFQS